MGCCNDARMRLTKTKFTVDQTRSAYAVRVFRESRFMSSNDCARSVLTCPRSIWLQRLALKPGCFLGLKQMSWVVCVVGLFPLGCAPVTSTIQITRADIALKAAESAGGERYSAYEFVMAHEYLQKAREELGYSDFMAARSFAEKALSYAEVARAQSLELASSGGDRP